MALVELLLAFNFSVGLNPPMDIHVPTSESIAKEIESQEKANEEKKD